MDSYTKDPCKPVLEVLCSPVYGVPQDSVFGPILFLLYTVVLVIAARQGVSVHSYADDTQLYLHTLAINCEATFAHLIECIDDIRLWMSSNRLKPRKRSLRVSERSISLPKLTAPSLLHCRCFHCLRQLRSIRRMLTSDTITTLVNSLVVSRIDYCNAVLAGVHEVHLRQLQRVLNAAVRLIVRKRKYDSISATLSLIHI